MRRAAVWAVVGMTIGVVGTAHAQPYLKGNDTGGGSGGNRPQGATPIVGIAEDARERIFEIFRRIHGKDEFGGGVGAGLTIARRAVELAPAESWVNVNAEREARIDRLADHLRESLNIDLIKSWIVTLHRPGRVHCSETLIQGE